MTVRCEFTKDCCAIVTHTDGSFVYCAEHAVVRSGWKRCRKFKPAEIKYMRENAARAESL